MKKTLLLILNLILVLSVILAGCTSNKQTESSTDDDGESVGDGPVKITIFAPQNAETDLQTNSFSKLAEEKFNIDFEWQTSPFDSTAANEVRNIALASGDYPDLFMLIPWVDQFSQTDLMRYGKQGVVVPLNDLIDEYAPNIKAAMEEQPYLKSMATAPDGNIYGLPQLNECFHCSYGNKMWINTDWLEKLNLDMPTTHEEFKDVLVAFKTQDPNGNGKADEVALSGSPERPETSIVPFLMNGFIYDDSRTRLLLKDGKVDFAPNKEEWKQGLTYIKSLYDDGLIDPGAFTQNNEALQQLGDNADAQILGAAAQMHPGQAVSDPEYQKTYDAVAPLQGPNEAFATYNYPSSPGGTFVLTNKASEEAKIAAIKLVDYMYTEEGQIRAHFGEEDVSWRKPKDGEIAVEESVEPILATIPGEEGEEPRNDKWGAMAQYYQPIEFRNSWVSATDIYSPEGYERRLQEATHLYEGKEPSEVFPHWAIWIDTADTDEAAMLRTNIEDYVNQNALQFITGAKDINKEWDAYVDGLEQLNLKRYLEIMQKAYDNANF
jgi:putative aldouronate transport system substrate-binding protein